MPPLEEQLENLARKWEENGVEHTAQAVSDLRALLPLEITDEMERAGAKAMLTHERPWMDGQHPENQAGGIERRREAARACLSAALTQPQTGKVCPDCEGAGRVILDPMKGSFTSPCPTCSGTGKEKA